MNSDLHCPTAPGFDEATGLGSPNFVTFITRQD